MDSKSGVRNFQIVFTDQYVSFKNCLNNCLSNSGHLLLQDDRKDAKMEGLEYVSRAADMWTNLIGQLILDNAINLPW